MGRTTIISIVNTNVVVLSEYLPPELPLRWTITGYCYYIVIRHLQCRRWRSYLFSIIHMTFLLYHLMCVMIYLKRLNSVLLLYVFQMIISFELPVETTEPELGEPPVDLNVSDDAEFEIIKKGTRRGEDLLVDRDG